MNDKIADDHVHKFVPRWLIITIMVFQAFMLIALGGYIGRAEHQNHIQQDQIEAANRRQTEAIVCLIDYTTKLQDTLNIRDTTNTALRTVTIRWAKGYRELLLKQTIDPIRFVPDTNMYIESLQRIQQAVALTPFPDIKTCLAESGILGRRPSFDIQPTLPPSYGPPRPYQTYPYNN